MHTSRSLYLLLLTVWNLFLSAQVTVSHASGRMQLAVTVRQNLSLENESDNTYGFSLISQPNAQPVNLTLFFDGPVEQFMVDDGIHELS